MFVKHSYEYLMCIAENKIILYVFLKSIGTYLNWDSDIFKKKTYKKYEKHMFDNANITQKIIDFFYERQGKSSHSLINNRVSICEVVW